MKIAFDLDGVIAESYPAIRKDLFDRYGHDIEPTQTTYDIKVPEISADEVTRSIRECLFRDSGAILPYPKVTEALWEICRMTALPISIITARDKELMTVTWNWVWRNNKRLPICLYFFPCKEKVQVMKNLKVDAWVDDRLATANEAAEGIKTVFLVNRKWNIGRPTLSNVYRVDDLSRVTSFVKGACIAEGQDGE